MRWLAAVLLLGACAAAAPLPSARGLMVAPYGLQPGGTTLRIDFGRAEEGVIAPVSRLLGAQPVARGPVTGCGRAVTRAAWPDGLTLYFQDGDLAGWSAPADYPATADAAPAANERRQAGLVCA